MYKSPLLSQTHNHILLCHNPLKTPPDCANNSFGLSNSTSLPLPNTATQSNPLTTVSNLRTTTKTVCPAASVRRYKRLHLKSPRRERGLRRCLWAAGEAEELFLAVARAEWRRWGWRGEWGLGGVARGRREMVFKVN